MSWARMQALEVKLFVLFKNPMEKHTVYFTFLLSLLALPWSSGQRLPGKMLLVSREMWDNRVKAKETPWLPLKSQGTEDSLLTIERYVQVKVTYVKIFFLRFTCLCTTNLIFRQDLQGVGEYKIWKNEFLPYFSFLLLLWLSVPHNQSSVLCSFSFSIQGLTSHITVQFFTLAISFSNILHKTPKFEISGT